MKKQSIFKFVVMLVFTIMFAFQSQHALPNIFADEESALPNDEALVYAIQVAGLGFDPQDPNILQDAVSLDLSNKGIYSLEGLDYWNFPVLKSINLSFNRISTLQSIYFSTMPQLEEIVISNNYLNNISLSSLQLNKFIANNNSLTSIQLDFLNDSEDVLVSLNANKFEELSEIENSSNTNLPLVYLACNNISVPEEEIVPSNYELLLQNAKANTKFVLNGSLTLYESTLFPNLDVIVNEISLEIGETTFGFGIYNVEFYDDEVLIEDFESFEFRVVPPKPTILYIVDGQAVEYQTVFTKQVRLEFVTDVPNAVVFFRLGQGQWVEGNSLPIGVTGNFNIYTQVRIAGVVSDNNSTVVNVRMVAPIWFFMGFLTFIAFLLASFFGYYYFQRSRKWNRKK